MDDIQTQVARIFNMTRSMLFFRGIIMLILGIFIFIAPLQTLWWMTICLGAVVLVDGIMMLSASLQSRGDLKGIMAINASLLIILGIFSLLSPLMMDMLWIMLLGIWQFLAGLQYLFLRKGSRHSAFTLLNGIVTALAGIFFMFLPFAGLLAASWLIGAVLLTSAFLSFVSGWKLKAAH